MLAGAREELKPGIILSSFVFYIIIAGTIGYFWNLTKGKLFFLYIALSEILGVSRSRIGKLLERSVQRGRIAPWLVKPVPLFFAFLPYEFGRFLARFTINFAAYLVFSTFLGFPRPVFFILAPLSFLISYSYSFIFGVLSFKLGKGSSLQLIIDKIVFILGGVIIPSNFLPPWLREINKFLPFKYGIAEIAYAGCGLKFSLAGIAIWSLLLPGIALLTEKLVVNSYEVGG